MHYIRSSVFRLFYSFICKHYVIGHCRDTPGVALTKDTRDGIESKSEFCCRHFYDHHIGRGALASNVSTRHRAGLYEEVSTRTPARGGIPNGVPRQSSPSELPAGVPHSASLADKRTKAGTLYKSNQVAYIIRMTDNSLPIAALSKTFPK